MLKWTRLRAFAPLGHKTGYFVDAKDVQGVTSLISRGYSAWSTDQFGWRIKYARDPELSFPYDQLVVYDPEADEPERNEWGEVGY